MSPQAWPPVPPFTQSAVVTSIAGWLTVTFPHPFAAPPHLQVTVVQTGGSVVPAIQNLTATSVQLGSVTLSPLAFRAGDPIHWTATGAPA